VTLTIVYDNNSYEETGVKGLRTSWGFACWVETPSVTVLFDTGGDGATLLHNMQQLDLDPSGIDAVVLSHAHGDHTGGLRTLLDSGVRSTVYAPASFSSSFKEGVRQRADLVEVRDWTSIAPGIHSSGELGTGIVEQSLVVETREGIVVITGCAHPGVVEIVRWVRDRTPHQIALVVGGFHLGGTSRSDVEEIISDLQGLGVQTVAPCHCTGDDARKVFKKVLGDGCALAGVGWSREYELKTDE
jgi:7,8-dihydropterin-6-yl-methyl-4-(beta-D-ribofuranosyl)aminobenzene 5'-phosphate synthase